MGEILYFDNTRIRKLESDWMTDYQRIGVPYEPIDLSIPLVKQMDKVDDIFLWLKGTILRQDLDINDLEHADGRRRDLERLLDVCFGDEQERISKESRDIILTAYYDAWKCIWKERNQKPYVKKLLRLAVKSDGPFLKFVSSKEMDEMSVKSFLRAIDGRVLEGIPSLKLSEGGKDGNGFLLVADTDFSIYTLKSLLVLASSKVAWTDAKVVNALKRSRLVSPVIAMVDAEHAQMFSRQSSRYER